MFEAACVFATSLIGYLIGSLSPALLLANRKGVDIRSIGTRNPGTVNAAYSMGLASGAIVLVLDILKTVIPYWIARILNPAIDWAGPLAGLCALIGHIFPCWHRFKGGKGLACLVGLALATLPFVISAPVILGCLGVSVVSGGSRLVIPASCICYGVGIAVFVTGAISVMILLAADVLVIARNVSVVNGSAPGSELTSEDVLRKG